jgi:signal peptidase II
MEKKSLFNLKRKDLFFFSIVLLVIIFDQLSKYLIRLFKPFFDFKILKIQLIKNSGAGFGILQNKTLFLGILSLIVVFMIFYYYRKIPENNLVQVGFSLFVAGAIGNMIDRLFIGYVTDFIYFKFWPAFNIADACLSIGVILIIIFSFRKE